MSCHDIGRGMASVVDQVVEEYSNNKIELSPARRIIRSCVKGVRWCDGNDYEALQTIMDNTCGWCLRRMIPRQDFLYDITDVDESFFEMEDLASSCVCEKCLAELLKRKKSGYVFDEVKGNCEKCRAGWYFKMKDLFQVECGRTDFDKLAQQYGYEI